MARMIDADRLLRELTALSHGQVWPGWTYDGIRLLIERQPTLTPPAEDNNVPTKAQNEPLTLEELREMDGEPVWFDTIKRWGIVRVCGYGISVLTKSGEYDVTRMKFYRRPPEEEI